MNRLKQVGAAMGMSVVSLGMMATSAFASHSIVNTGNGFTYTNTHTTTTSVGVSNTNMAYIGQSSYTTANTGGNTSNSNIFGGGVTSGPAGVSNYFGVMANGNWTSIHL